MKYILIVFLFGVCLFVGYYFFSRYDRRRKFFSALVMFAEKLAVDINFSREKLKILVSNLDVGIKKHLCGIDQTFLDYLEKKGELNIDILKKADCLKQNEKEMVLLFLRTLGRSDVDNQTKEIQTFIKRFSDMAEKSSAEYKKYGAMSIKLGIVAGLFVVVILI